MANECSQAAHRQAHGNCHLHTTLKPKPGPKLSPVLISIKENAELCIESLGGENSIDCDAFANHSGSRLLSDTFVSLNQERSSKLKRDLLDPRSVSPQRYNPNTGFTQQSASIAAINCAFDFLPCLIALIWAFALYFSMSSVS